MYLKYSNQVFELSFQNFFKNGNDFLWAFVYFSLNLSIIPKFLTLQKISLFFLQREIFNIPTAHETDVPTPSLSLSLSHVIRSGTTSHNKTSVDKDVQANSSQRDIKARRKTNPFDPYTEPLRTCKRLQPRSSMENQRKH